MHEDLPSGFTLSLPKSDLALRVKSMHQPLAFFDVLPDDAEAEAVEGVMSFLAHERIDRRVWAEQLPRVHYDHESGWTDGQNKTF
jgi:hypothetical protein